MGELGQYRQFWIEFHRANRFPTRFSDLLELNGQEKRANYELLNLPLGFLFENFNDRVATPKMNASMCAYAPDREIFDTVSNQLVPFDEQLFEQIPRTFTFCPRPTDAESEVDYYVRSVGLPKHKFIWSNDVENTGLPSNLYAAVHCNENKMFRGRYTFTPLLPQIKNLGRIGQFGFYIMEQDEWEKLFGVL